MANLSEISRYLTVTLNHINFRSLIYTPKKWIFDYRSSIVSREMFCTKTSCTDLHLLPNHLFILEIAFLPQKNQS